MRLPDTLDAARDLALQKIGLNVVNFQRMEAALKCLVSYGRLEGTASEIQAKLKDQIRSASTMTMGTLVPRLVETLYPLDVATLSPSPNPTEPIVSFAITMDGGVEAASELKRNLDVVVKARNHLIHEMLAGFNLDSIESCHALCVALDEQRAQVIPMHTYLDKLVQRLRMIGSINADQLAAALEALPPEES